MPLADGLHDVEPVSIENHNAAYQIPCSRTRWSGAAYLCRGSPPRTTLEPGPQGRLWSSHLSTPVHSDRPPVRTELNTAYGVAAALGPGGKHSAGAAAISRVLGRGTRR